MLKKVKKIQYIIRWLQLISPENSGCLCLHLLQQQEKIQLPTKQRYHWEARNNAKLGIHFASLHPVSIK